MRTTRSERCRRRRGVLQGSGKGENDNLVSLGKILRFS
jgi:hypothetical protein